MEGFSQKLFLNLLFLAYHFSYLTSVGLAYSLPKQYFIDCGSDSDNNTVNGRTFIGDLNSGKSFAFSGSSSSDIQATDPPAGSNAIYQTARIFRKSSWYEVDVLQSGTYVVRFHFYPSTSPENLFDARFDVSAYGFPLLSNFSVGNTTSLPNIQEFSLKLNGGKFRITFAPSQGSSMAFINAIEAFVAPEDFIRSSPPPPHVTPAGNSNTYSGLLSQVLHVVHRINVGGPALALENDTLGRNWELDGNYLQSLGASKKLGDLNLKPNYGEVGATEYTAPDQVYNTAMGINVTSGDSTPPSNTTWRFNVSKNVTHLVRVHFCDIISQNFYDRYSFNLYIYNNFAKEISPFNDNIVFRVAAPFYYDFVVDSENSGLLNVSICQIQPDQPAFLNGVEVMELLGVWDHPDAPPNKHKPSSVVTVISSVAGGLSLILIFAAVLIFVIRRKKEKKRPRAIDFPLGALQGSSYGGSTERTSLHDLNLGLRLPISDVRFATDNFNKVLIIGEGGFGKVYRGTLPNGVKVAVKRSETGHDQGIPEFHTEINVLSRIRHRHLVSLIGYCDEGNEMILVYEFMERGTLRDHLYKVNGSGYQASQSKLTWEQRLEICIGAAKGLTYLHAGSDGSIIHRDVKSTNILLGEDYTAKVSDFGLSRSGPLDQTHVITDVKGSFGYFDPEYFMFMQLTQKSDVYSFGVVLVEVLCARPVIDKAREQENLTDWALSRQKKGQLKEIIDPFIASDINPNSLRVFWETIEKCLEECGTDRPSMVDVLRNLEYALGLQRSRIPRQPNEDTATDVSVDLPTVLLNRLPSHSSPFSENDFPVVSEDMDSSCTDASQVFSQLKVDEAR